MKSWFIFAHCKYRYAWRFALGLFLLLLKTTFPSFASSYGPVYPYTQKTENGKVKIHSIPYGVHDGPYGLGETFVYAGGKLLYSIDKYFTNTVFTYGNGEFLIEIDFWPRFTAGRSIREFNGTITTSPRTYNGNAAYIYKKGKLFKTIAFKDLKIDTATLRTSKYDDDFAWWYLPDYTTKDPLKIAMDEHLAYLEKGKLFLISSDNQLISIDLETGEIHNTPDAYQALKGKTNWINNFSKRNYHKRHYRGKFYLPRLEGGNSIELNLAAFLHKKIAVRTLKKDDALVQIYIHTLLINKQGKCERIYVSTAIRSDIKKDWTHLERDNGLKALIEDWFMHQNYRTNSFTRGFPKFKYSNFIHLK